MTAIAAVALREGSNIRTCERMLAALRPYGRDGENILEVDGAGMAAAYARRTPEDAFDRQPIAIGGGEFALVTDCRIDNRAELISALRLGGGGNRLSDAAIVAHAFDHWGVASFDRLRGDFAIAIWDAMHRRFILARDPTGGAPLFVHASAGAAAVASMPRGLHALEAVPRRADTGFMVKAIREGGMFDSGSFWEGIGRVLPGHFGFLDWEGLRQERYWYPPSVRSSGRSFEDYADGLREHVERAVTRQLRGTTEVATHLSAGLDSGAVTGAAAAVLRGSGRVVAFTAAPRDGFDARQGVRLEDESMLAAATARMHPNIEHVVVRPGSEWATAAIDMTFDYWQSPATNICNLAWTEQINEAVRARGLRVLMPASVGNFALSYDGGHALSEPWARRDWIGLAANVAAQVRAPVRVARDLARTLGGPLVRRIRANRAAHRWQYFPSRESFADAALDPVYGDMLMRVLTRIDRGSHNKGILARWGIDVRDPSTDRDLIEYVATVPLRMFRRGGVERSLIRAAAAGWMAPEALRERRRGLQAADWYEQVVAHRGWLREQLDAIGENPDAAKVVDLERLRRILDKTPDDWRDPRVVAEHRHALLRGISAGHFIRRASGANR